MADNFILQLLHHADFEGNTNAIEDAPRLGALFDYFDDFYVGNTLKLSGGDNWIPSPWYNSQVSDISALTTALQNVYETYFTLTPGSLSGLTMSPGVIDQAIVNVMGIDASTLGNHEFDQGADDVARIIEMTVNGQLDQVATSDITNIGTLFPYITANLDFSNSELADAAATVATAIESLSVGIAGDADVDTPAEIQALVEQDRIAPATWVEVAGEKIGIVGATTQRLAAISSPGEVDVVGASGDDMDVLATQVQAQVDGLLATHTDMNKVVLISHLQDYNNEASLASKLSGVDIILSAGSDAIFADDTDVLRDGQVASELYPLVHTAQDGKPVLQINTDGQYQYLGRLVVEFDPEGVVLVDSIDAEESGAYAATDAMVTSLYGESDPYAEGSIGGMVQELANAVDSVIGAKIDNVAGYTDVYLNGVRSSVRNEETNLGNLTADANLAAAQFYIDNNPDHYQEAPLVSLKNGGGIRADIGLALGVSGPEAPVGGAVTQLDIETALAFNNGLAIVETTASGLVTLLEHGVANAGTTNGRFPQVGGMSFSYDTDNEPGNRIQSLQLKDANGQPGLLIVEGGQLVVDPDQPMNIVSLDFLALNDGDGYPFSEVASQISALVTADSKTFDTPFTEQDALYDYLQANHGSPETAFTMADTDASADTRLQNLNERDDAVIANAGDLEIVGMTPIGTYATGVFDESAAEIVAFDPATDRMFLVSAAAAELKVIDNSDPSNPTLIGRLDMTPYGAQVNSVAVNNGMVAVAVAGATPEAGGAHPNGNIVVFSADVALSTPQDEEPAQVLGDAATAFESGPGPDMVTFTPDGTKILSANEAEAVDQGYTGKGGITIVTLGANGVTDATAQTLDFSAWDGREGELRERGVRIADGIDASEDLEPEYIAISDDGTQAVITLQENNALAFLDLTGETPTIVDVVPMGLKNHERGDLEMVEYAELTGSELPTLGTDAMGNAIPVGGFSGLHFTGTADNGDLNFVTVSDRGPNGSPTDVDSDSANERPFLLPDYQARVTNLSFNPTTGAMTIGDSILLKDAEGNPITGLPNIAGVDEEPVEVTTDGYNTLSYDPLGADLEGIYVDSTGGMWMVDEYRPSIYHFDSTGTLVNRFIPEGTHALAGEDAADAIYGTETLPEHLSDRQANRGFEALAVDEANGKLYAFVQSPLNSVEGNADTSGALIRIVEMSIAEGSMGEATAEYAYLLARPALNTGNVDKIGDAVFNAETGTIFVFERDSAEGLDAKKVLYEINLDGATNLLTAEVTLPAGKTALEELTVDELLAAGINPVYKEMVGNLASMGYAPNDKAEGMALLGDGRGAVINDNDFGVNGAGTETIGLGIFAFNGSNTLDTDRDDDEAILTAPTNLLGAYMPDAIASFTVDGKAFYITANEGDSRDIDESRLKNVENLDENLVTDAHEDLTVLTDMIDVDGDGDIDRLVAFGARSASIFDSNGNRVWDSGNLFEVITAEAFPDQFNATNDKSGMDARSDDKGPEPEGVSIAQVGNNIYALVTLERIGGVAILDVTDPYAPEFVNYVNNRNFAADPESALAGDLGPESTVFISADDSPTGEALITVANEVSGTVTNFAVQTALGNQLFGTSGHDTLNATVQSSSVYGYEGNDNLTGSDGDDQLFGGQGNDTLSGGAGNDTLHGGAGINVLDGGDDTDTAIISTAGDVSIYMDGAVFVDGAIEANLSNIENLTLAAGDGWVNGTDLANTIDIGQAGDIYVYGYGGDDLVKGLSGGDIFLGGDGHDIAEFDGSKDQYNVRVATPAEMLAMQTRVTLNETFGVYAVNAVSGDQSTAYVQAESLRFGDGLETDLVFIETVEELTAQLSNDLQDNQILFLKDGMDLSGMGFEITAENVTVILNDSIGDPRFYLADDVASFSLEGTGDGRIYGNALDNVLRGNEGNNRIDGGGGDDTLIARGGDDYLIGRSGNDILVAGEGADSVSAGSGNDVLYATGGGADELMGGSGDDMIMLGNGEAMVLAGSGIDLIQMINDDQDASLDVVIGDLTGSDVLDMSALSVESLNDHNAILSEGDLDVALKGFTKTNGDPIDHNVVFAASTEPSVDAAMDRMGSYEAPHSVTVAQLMELETMNSGLLVNG